MKQETLEEAAEKYDENDPNDEYGKSYRAFIEGAKWQQERMYSEEEVVDLINLRTCDLDLAYSKKPIYYLKTKEWFEQFKKK